MPSAAPVFGVTVVSAAQDAAAVEAALRLDRPTRRLIQQGLRNEGFDPGTPDGLFGPRTRSAIRAWQAARDEPQTGYLDGDQVAVLRAAAIPPPGTAAPEPENPTSASAPVADAPPPVEAPDAGLPTNAQVSVVPDALAPSAVESPEAPALASPSGELPPEILIDRRLVRVDRLLARDDHRAAHDMMNEVLALQREHALELPAEFHFKYAQVALASGLPETAVESLNDYLLAAGREGEFYREALELLDAAEEAVRRADAERRRAEAARARLRENSVLVRRQIEVAASALPRDRLRSGGLGPAMVKIAAGRFTYLSGRVFTYATWPVVFDQAFAISRYEVTRGEFERFVESSGHRRAWRGSEDHRCFLSRWIAFQPLDTHPVRCVSIREAMAYADWLSQQTGQRYRLPSAAEWQYAARAGSTEAVYVNHSDPHRMDVCGRANLGENPSAYNGSCTDGVEEVAEVGQFPPNGVGLHDMLGNVSEWVLTCADERNDSDGYRTAMDGAYEHPDRCKNTVRVAMGGRWDGYPAQDLVFEVDWFYGEDDWPGGSGTVGFRVVRELPSPRGIR